MQSESKVERKRENTVYVLTVAVKRLARSVKLDSVFPYKTGLSIENTNVKLKQTLKLASKGKQMPPFETHNFFSVV